MLKDFALTIQWYCSIDKMHRNSTEIAIACFLFIEILTSIYIAPAGISFRILKWKWSGSVMSDSLHTPWTVATRLLCPWDFPGKSTGMGCHFLLQGIFPTQGSNPGFLHCKQMLYSLGHQGNLLEYLTHLKYLSHYLKDSHSDPQNNMLY